MTQISITSDKQDYFGQEIFDLLQENYLLS